MTDGLHYPDNLYADHEERKARRVANQAPTGAYRSVPEMPESERKLRTARQYLHHALLLVDEALAVDVPKPEPGSLDALRIERGGQPERTPKWHPSWPTTPPNCDGLSARGIRAPHPMSAEAIRDHDERLAVGESHL